MNAWLPLIAVLLNSITIIGLLHRVGRLEKAAKSNTLTIQCLFTAVAEQVGE